MIKRIFRDFFEKINKFPASFWILVPSMLATSIVVLVTDRNLENSNDINLIISDFVYLFSLAVVIELSTSVGLKKRLFYNSSLILAFILTRLSGLFYSLELIFPFVFVLFISFLERRNNPKRVVVKGFTYLIFISFLQFMALIISGIDFSNIFYVMIDEMHVTTFFIALILLIGGDENGLGFMFFADKQTSELAEEDQESYRLEKEKILQLPLEKRILVFAIWGAIQISQVLLLLLTVRILGNALGGLIIFFSFVSSGLAIKNRYHLDSFLKCTGLSLIFMVVALSLVSFGNYFFPFLAGSLGVYIFIGLSLSFLSNKFKVNQDKKAKAEIELSNLKGLPLKEFDLENATEEEIRVRCDILRKRKDYTDLTVKLFAVDSKLSEEEFVEKYKDYYADARKSYKDYKYKRIKEFSLMNEEIKKRKR